MLFAIVMMMAEVPYVFFSRKAKGDEVSDSLRAVTDSLKKVADSLMADSEYRQVADTLLALGEEAAAKLKRDTTTMDSIELAIYKHNKAIDDSLALDSINRSRKNGIDSPVEYSADDSLTYSAASGLAHLYGNSSVKYQNMDLASGQ